MTIRLYCDFDGTIVPEDVGNCFFERFSGTEMWEDNALYISGAISARELFLRNAARIGAITAVDVDRFCAGFSVDASFPGFVAWAEHQGCPLMVLSDGLDAYIARILASASLRVPFRSNELLLREGGGCSVTFPSPDEECDRCANCKRNHMLVETPDNDFIVLVGDGVSDFCPARYADLVFAKGRLITHCQEQNISFRTFSSFDDIARDLETLRARKRIRKRRSAELLRRSAWNGG